MGNCFLELAGSSIRSLVADMCRLLTFKPLQNLHLGISRMLMETVLPNLSLNTMFTKLEHTPNDWKPLLQVEKAVLHVFNAFSTEIGNDCGGAGLRLDFSRGNTSSKMNSLVNRIGVQGMLMGMTIAR